jgi:short-subunit dehydrogenase
MGNSTISFREKYGPWALVAGASRGLGAEFAVQLAGKGLNIFLVARNAEMLESLGARLTSEYGVQARYVSLDLTRPDAASIITAATDDIEIGLLIYNAGFSVVGPFFARPLEEHLREINTNCRTPLALTHSLGQRMFARKRGGIVLMSSLSAVQGSALIANYAATKSYSLILAEGLWDELREHGIDVLACNPSSVDTPNYRASAPTRSSPMAAMSPRLVAAETLAALGRQPSVIPGRANRLAAFFMRRILTLRAAIAVMGRTMRAMYS